MVRLRQLGCLLLCVVIGCTGPIHRKAENSFYYWKTSFTSDPTTQAFITKEHIGHFYIHYMDVVWDDEHRRPVPVAEIANYPQAAPFVQSHFTPVVFITNHCLEKMGDDWCDSLGDKIFNKIAFITNRLREVNADAAVDEIQIDCDWTAGTRDKYFKVLTNFKKRCKQITLSATIRLYPYKYPEKMGVPPVDRGLLMCYNITNIKNGQTENSILRVKDLQDYLSAGKYPLPLDIALPVFGWYAWFRQDQFKGIIYPNEKHDFAMDTTFCRRQEKNLQVLRDTAMGNNYLLAGDYLRAELPTAEALAQSARLLQQHFPDTKRISLFYWDNFLIRKNEAIIDTVYSVF